MSQEAIFSINLTSFSYIHIRQLITKTFPTSISHIKDVFEWWEKVKRKRTQNNDMKPRGWMSNNSKRKENLFVCELLILKSITSVLAVGLWDVSAEEQKKNSRSEKIYSQWGWHYMHLRTTFHCFIQSGSDCWLTFMMIIM